MLGYDTDNNDIDQVNIFLILGVDLDMPTLNDFMSFGVKEFWINNWCLNPESVAWPLGLCDLVGPVTGVDADSAQSFGYHLACKVQLRKITKNLSGTAKRSRQSSLAACVRAASTRLLITSRHTCLEICLTEGPHAS